MSTLNELIADYNNGKNRPVIEFTQRTEDELEAYFDASMRARVVSIQYEHDGVYRIRLDVNEFEAHNKVLEKSNYYDANSIPCLTATEAGYYPKAGIEDLYLGADDDTDGVRKCFFKILKKETTTVTIDKEALTAGIEAVFFHIATLNTRVNHLKDGREENANELAAEETRLDDLKRFAKTLGVKDADI